MAGRGGGKTCRWGAGGTIRRGPRSPRLGSASPARGGPRGKHRRPPFRQTQGTSQSRQPSSSRLAPPRRSAGGLGVEAGGGPKRRASHGCPGHDPAGRPQVGSPRTVKTSLIPCLSLPGSRACVRPRDTDRSASSLPRSPFALFACCAALVLFRTLFVLGDRTYSPPGGSAPRSSAKPRVQTCSYPPPSPVFQETHELPSRAGPVSCLRSAVESSSSCSPRGRTCRWLDKGPQGGGELPPGRRQRLRHGGLQRRYPPGVWPRS